MANRIPATARGFSKSDCEKLAAFRFALRQYLSFSEHAANQAGLAPHQYQALLAIKGYPGRDFVSITELARHLLIRHNSAVGLADRLEAKGLVTRRADADDRRKVNIRLTAKGTRVFEGLAATHRAELRRVGPQLSRFFVDFAPPPSRS